MTTDYWTMIAGAAAMQAASVTALVAIAARYVEFAAREGEFVVRTLSAGSPALQQVGSGMQEDPILRLCDRYVEGLRGFAGLPRVSALIFLGELDRIPWPAADAGVIHVSPREWTI